MSLKTIYINLKGHVIEKITGSVPTENNYTDAEKEKLVNMTGGTLTPEQIADIAAQVNGTPGPKGDQGEIGPQGLKGDIGNPGTNGAKGDTGSNGTNGTTPVKNIDYFDGVKGDTGTPGSDGSQGLKGDQGVQGIPGQNGTNAPVRLFTNLAAPVVTSGTTEKVLLQLQIPANSAVVGSTYRAWIIGNSSSTGTLIFKVRCGNLGTIADTIDWTAVTSAAQAANARAGFDVLITIRSATTIKAEGVGYAGAVQLPTYVAAPTTPAITISGIWYINLTVICSSGTFTAQVGNIEEIK